MFRIRIYIISDVMIRNHDGSCRYYIKAYKGDEVVKEQGYCLRFDCTTRNRSYLEAVIAALSRMNTQKFECEVLCDYLQCVSDAEELDARAKKNFRKKNGMEYANADLWRKLHKALEGKKWTWRFLAREEIEKTCQISETQ